MSTNTNADSLTGSSFATGSGGTRTSEPLYLHGELNGIALSPSEFDEAVAEPGFRYELISGVLIVNPASLRQERDRNEELGYLLRAYQRHHRQGKSLDATVPEEDVILGDNRRRVDRAIWCGLGRLPRRGEMPTICVEFVSAGRRSQIPDYLEKRGEYKRGGVSEYWIIDRFARQLQVFRLGCAADEHLVIVAGGSYEPDKLPGFTLRLDELLAVADRWEGV